MRIHGGDYAQSHSLARLVCRLWIEVRLTDVLLQIGTPVCTGFDKGGQLTECVRRRPISVVLIQEYVFCDHLRGVYDWTDTSLN